MRSAPSRIPGIAGERLDVEWHDGLLEGQAQRVGATHGVATAIILTLILGALGGTPRPLVDAIVNGQIRGAVGVVGCNNPKIKHDLAHTELTKRLIENDILVLVTGCSAVANGKAGHMVPEAAAMAGPGLQEICGALGIPPRGPSRRTLFSADATGAASPNALLAAIVNNNLPNNP